MGRHWVAIWSASPQPPTPQTLGAKGFDDQTVRNVVFTSAGGSMVRVLSSRTCSVPAAAGRSGGGGILGWRGGRAPGQRPALSHSQDGPPGDPGRRRGAERPGAPESGPLQRLVISVFRPTISPGPATEHAVAQQTNYVAVGDHALDTGAAAYGDHDSSWYFVAGVDA